MVIKLLKRKNDSESFSAHAIESSFLKGSWWHTPTGRATGFHTDKCVLPSSLLCRKEEDAIHSREGEGKEFLSVEMCSQTD